MVPGGMGMCPAVDATRQLQGAPAVARIFRSGMGAVSHTYSLLSKVLVIHFLAGVATTILITKIAVTQQQRLCNKK